MSVRLHPCGLSSGLGGLLSLPVPNHQTELLTFLDVSWARGAKNSNVKDIFGGLQIILSPTPAGSFKNSHLS